MENLAGRRAVKHAPVSWGKSLKIPLAYARGSATVTARVGHGLLVVSLLVIAAAAQAPPDAWSPQLSLQVRGVGAVLPSPDGRMAAYSQDSAIFLVRLDGSRRTQLTRDGKGESSFAFSPDSRLVYFVSRRSGKPNLWRIPVDGGEAEKLTDWQGEIGGYRLSPDGKWIALAGHDPTGEETKARPPRRRGRVVGEDITNHNLWVMAADPGKGELRRVLNAPYHVVNFNWSPDSRYIAFEHHPDSGENSWPQSDVSEVEIEGAKVRVVAAGPAGEGEPHYSPDGRLLAYLRTADKASWAGEEQIVLVPRQGGAPRVVPDTFDVGPSLSSAPRSLFPALLPRKAMGVILGWSSDSTRLLFTGAKGTRFVLYSVSVDGLTRAVYTPDGVLNGATLNATRTHVGFTQESSNEPPEAFVIALAGGAPARISQANADLPKRPLGETRRIHWKSKDGLEIEGLLTLPVGYEAGRKYPLLAIVHGGPMGWWNESFIGGPDIYPVASFAARGYAILRPNIRGSGGYGKKYRFANVNDWGGRDFEDLMTGIDHLVSGGIADTERLAVMGWSYGGYMTAWAITHTNRFKAAIVGAGPTNLWSMTGTTDIVSFLPYYLSAEPWTNLQTYLEHSPMYHVKGVTTPTLILHGEADLRVPVSQAYELYNALKRQGATTQLVVYPGMTHGPGDAETRLDLMERHLEWTERYLR